MDIDGSKAAAGLNCLVGIFFLQAANRYWGADLLLREGSPYQLYCFPPFLLIPAPRKSPQLGVIVPNLEVKF